MGALARSKLKRKLTGTLWFSFDLKIFKFHLEEAGELLVGLRIFEVKDGTFSAVVKLVKGCRFAKWCLFSNLLGDLYHLIVLELSRMGQVLQAKLAVALGAPQDNHVVSARRHVDLYVLLTGLKLWPDNLKTAKLGPNRLLEPVRGIVLSIDVAIPTVESLYVAHSDHISAIVFVLLQIGHAGVLG